MFEHKDDRKSCKSRNNRLNVKIDEKNLFDQLVKSDMRTYHNISKIETGQSNDYTTDCLLDYNYFNKHYKMIAIGLSKITFNAKCTETMAKHILIPLVNSSSISNRYSFS